MLLVKTFLKESTIPGAGMGCFAGEFIPRGTKIWEINPNLDRRYDDNDLKHMDEFSKKFIEIYAYRYDGIYVLCVDNARFFNHSKDPNTLDPSGENATYALRDINEGEEILSDYSTFGITGEDLKFNMGGL